MDNEITKYNIFDLERSFSLQCLLCRKRIGQKTLGNMFNHLKDKHPDELKKLLLFAPPKI